MYAACETNMSRAGLANSGALFGGGFTLAVFFFMFTSPYHTTRSNGTCVYTQPLDGDSIPSTAGSIPSPNGAIVAFNKANLDGSDKGTPGHSYDIMYGPFLAPFLSRPVRLLEIGVANGRSLKLWERLFPFHELIVGIGYGPGSQVEDTFKRNFTDKHVLYTGSQADPSFLDRVKADLGNAKFDIIIDDGSHVPWHQIFTLEYLFKDSLKDGGLYIIEDIETSYWDAPGAGLYGYTLQDAGIGKRGNVVEKLKGVADTLNRGMLLDPDYHVLHDKTDHLVSHIMFSQNAVALWKKDTALWVEAQIQEKHIDSYGFGTPQIVDKTRSHYKSWKSQNTWDVAGMQRA